MTDRSIRLANRVADITGISRRHSDRLFDLAHKRCREYADGRTFNFNGQTSEHRNLWELGGSVGWGEVLGYNRFALHPIASVVRGWMGSPTHRAIITNESYHAIGASVIVRWTTLRWYYCVIVTTRVP